MKYIYSALLFIVYVTAGYTQDFAKLDDSPMDAAYYPPRAAFRSFAKTDEEKSANQPKIRVLYSRPQKKDRKVFGGLLKFGEMWRVGANESTEILFMEDAKVGDYKIKKGRYTLYAVPREENWEIYFSSDLDGWGHYSFDPENSTIAKIIVPTEPLKVTVEALSVVFEATTVGALMIIAWDDTMVRVPIEI